MSTASDNRWSEAFSSPPSAVELNSAVIARNETDRGVASDGPSEGDIVVTAGVNRLREYEKVRTLQGEAK
jgi:hypothetical protein